MVGDWNAHHQPWGEGLVANDRKGKVIKQQLENRGGRWLGIAGEGTWRRPQGREVEICKVEEVELGCGAACVCQVLENTIQAMVEDSQDAVIFTGGSRGEDGRLAGGTPSGGKRVGWEVENGSRDRILADSAELWRKCGRGFLFF